MYIKKASILLFLSATMVGLALISSCTDKDDPKPDKRNELDIDWVSEERYTSATLQFKLSPEHGTITEAGYAVGDQGGFYNEGGHGSSAYTFNNYPITSYTVPESNVVQIEIDGLEVETGYDFLFYYIDGIDTVMVYNSIFTDYLRPLGIYPGTVKGKNSELQVVSVYYYDHEDIKFYMGDIEIEPTSVEETSIYNISKLIFSDLDFESYDSLEVYGMLGDEKLLAGKAYPYGDGSGLYTIDTEKNYIFPSDWNIMAFHDEIIFPGEQYVQLGDIVYFNGAIRDVSGDWLMSLDLETYEVKRVMLEEELLFHLMAKDDQLYGVDLDIVEKDGADSSVFIIHEIDPVSKTMNAIDTISLAFDIYSYSRFFSHGDYAYFLEQGLEGSNQRMNLFTGEVTEMTVPSIPSGKSYTRPYDYRLTDNYVLFESYENDRDIVEVVIYDVAADSWTYLDYPGSIYGTMLVFEYEDIPAFVKPDQESYFYLPFSHEWRKLNDCPYPTDQIAGWSFTGRMFNTTKGPVHVDRNAVVVFDPIGLSTIGITVD